MDCYNKLINKYNMIDRISLILSILLTMFSSLIILKLFDIIYRLKITFIWKILYLIISPYLFIGLSKKIIGIVDKKKDDILDEIKKIENEELSNEEMYINVIENTSTVKMNDNISSKREEQLRILRGCRDELTRCESVNKDSYSRIKKYR